MSRLTRGPAFIPAATSITLAVVLAAGFGMAAAQGIPEPSPPSPVPSPPEPPGAVSHEPELESIARVGTQFVRGDNLTGNGVAAPSWIPERVS